ncbi:MAG: polysaccharide export protein [Limnobacter sp.]|nr:polysaccharide export protein [Limnobacter sp.]
MNVLKLVGLLGVLALSACASSSGGPVGTQAELEKARADDSLIVPVDAGSATEVSRYRLGNGDVITIRVFDEPGLSIDKVKMSDAGTVQYVSLGEVKIAGMTVPEVEALVTRSLKGTYLKDPRVTVTIDEYRPYFLSGQVVKTGSFPYQPGLTVTKAITIAGGFAPRADENKLFIQKDDMPAKRFVVGPNTTIEPGDIITVGESFF